MIKHASVGFLWKARVQLNRELIEQKERQKWKLIISFGGMQRDRTHRHVDLGFLGGLGVNPTLGSGWPSLFSTKLPHLCARIVWISRIQVLNDRKPQKATEGSHWKYSSKLQFPPEAITHPPMRFPSR